jgi:hypothetical protein
MYAVFILSRHICDVKEKVFSSCSLCSKALLNLLHVRFILLNLLLQLEFCGRVIFDNIRLAELTDLFTEQSESLSALAFSTSSCTSPCRDFESGAFSNVSIVLLC